MATLQQLIEKAGQVAVLKAHPVGSYFITEEDRNPAKILELGGVSTWVKLEGRVLLGASSTYPVGSEGGEATHKLSQNELPKVSGGVSQHGSEKGGFLYNGTGVCSVGITNQNAYYSVANLNVCGTGAHSGGTFSINFGNDQPHNNLQPYRSAYIWRRTA